MTEHKVEKSEHTRKNSFTDLREKPWMIATIVLAIALIVLLFIKSDVGTGSVSKSEVEQKLLSFVEAQTRGEVTASVLSNEKEGSLYKVTLDMQGQQVPVYVTLDGKYLVAQPIPLSQDAVTDSPGTEVPAQEVPKSDKPKVELFVMSYCPYGTQIEKGILPVVSLLKDKIDFKIRWVSYIMHEKKEIDENVVQYCIQKNENAKYLNYLQCFLNASDSAGCVKKVGINQANLNKCITETDKQFNVTANYNDKSSWLSGQFPLFTIDKADNELYGVQGSPTLVINGVQAESARSPAALLGTICSSFTTAPAECDDSTLSTANPSPGFGYGTSSADVAAANCGF